MTKIQRSRWDLEISVVQLVSDVCSSLTSFPVLRLFLLETAAFSSAFFEGIPLTSSPKLLIFFLIQLSCSDIFLIVFSAAHHCHRKGEAGFEQKSSQITDYLDWTKISKNSDEIFLWMFPMKHYFLSRETPFFNVFKAYPSQSSQWDIKVYSYVDMRNIYSLFNN